MKKEEAVHGETQQPLRWPEGQARTRIQDRQRKSAWKRTRAQYLTALEQELRRSGATDWLITHSDSSLDPGVAVYFSRRPQNQFAWQEALGMIGTVPTVDAINQQYRKLIRFIHPDGPSPDIEMFHALTEHRDRAIDWALGRHRADHEYVIAIDVFDELRLNINAVRVVLLSLRRIEDCGSPLMLERAFRGFAKQITAGEVANEPAIVA